VSVVDFDAEVRILIKGNQRLRNLGGEISDTNFTWIINDE
jgi:hypothetical protein